MRTMQQYKQTSEHKNMRPTTTTGDKLKDTQDRRHTGYSTSPVARRRRTARTCLTI